ncbi:hypothetical protein SUGI_0435020 [Cryptomeria japonica]|nr:hypothetical protein SUGI_0435020 [Cryptomeria japonica]
MATELDVLRRMVMVALFGKIYIFGCEEVMEYNCAENERTIVGFYPPNLIDCSVEVLAYGEKIFVTTTRRFVDISESPFFLKNKVGKKQIMEPAEEEKARKSYKRSALQGPRPPPLKISKAGIEKIGMSKQQQHQEQPPQQQQQRQRQQPVIIYTRSPEVIHTKPQDFMQLVQRLTGPSCSKKKKKKKSREKTRSQTVYGKAPQLPLILMDWF